MSIDGSNNSCGHSTDTFIQVRYALGVRPAELIPCSTTEKFYEILSKNLECEISKVLLIFKGRELPPFECSRATECIQKVFMDIYGIDLYSDKITAFVGSGTHVRSRETDDGVFAGEPVAATPIMLGQNFVLDQPMTSTNSSCVIS